jgi:Holliday junction resolvase RusA-like endonuclease
MAKTHAKANDHAADPDADLESHFGDATLRADEAPTFDRQVRVTFLHTRKRLADIDGLSGKAALDSIVALGILADDKTQQVAEVIHRQVKGEPERTEIVIEEI